MNAYTGNGTADRKFLAEAAMTEFAFAIPVVIIRRHDKTRWFDDPLMELPPLFSHDIKLAFPEVYQDATTQCCGNRKKTVQTN